MDCEDDGYSSSFGFAIYTGCPMYSAADYTIEPDVWKLAEEPGLHYRSSVIPCSGLYCLI